jgi:hypothetical protein
VPDAVKFHANKLLSGQWDPYPIDMAFQPPCMVSRALFLVFWGGAACVWVSVCLICWRGSGCSQHLCSCSVGLSLEPPVCADDLLWLYARET